MRYHWWLGTAVLFGVSLAPGCGQRKGEQVPPPAPPQPTDSRFVVEVFEDIPLTSSAFENEGRIPARYTCDGEDISPPLSWDDPPEGTKELAVICDDPDAAGGTLTYWVMWGISPDLPSLPEAVPNVEHPPAVGGAKQGKNDFGKIGYGGPCPPRGPAHQYSFQLYALDTKIDLDPGSSADDLLDATEEHVLGEGELIGLYSRGER